VLGEEMEKRILIVEDEIRISNLLKMYLEREAFLVEVADNGDDGLAKSMSEDFDLIILDVSMPGKDGFTVLEELRRLKSTPVIMLSARGETSDLNRGFELGANEYIIKPFSPRDVIEKIKTILLSEQPC
jgi:DNA-binding response OmpR family regulator